MRLPPAMLFLCCAAAACENTIQPCHGRCRSYVIAAVQGDSQEGRPGEALAVVPRVRVLDDAHRPAAGLAIHFGVQQGGGSLSQPDSVTDSLGFASAGTWVLGRDGVNLVRVTVADSFAVDIRATALIRTAAGIQFTSVTPFQLSNVDSVVPLRVQVESQFALASVVASIHGVFDSLAHAGGNDWSVDLDVRGMPYDSLPVVITATDVYGTVSEYVLMVEHDPPPRLSISSPFRYAVAMPTVRISASCRDQASGGCDSITVHLADSTQVGRGKDSVALTLDFSSRLGSTVWVSIRGWDAHQHTSVNVPIDAVRATGLVSVVTVRGNVRDVLGGRVLYEDTVSQRWGVFTIATGADTTITGVPVYEYGNTGANGWLAPGGAVISGYFRPDLPRSGRWWSGGDVSSLPGPVSNVAGRFAGVWDNRTSSVCAAVADLSTGLTVTMPGHCNYAEPLVASDGRAIYGCYEPNLSYPSLCFYHDGVVDTLYHSTGSTTAFGVLDTAQVLYNVSTVMVGVTGGLWRHANGVDSLIDSRGGADLKVSGGWAAWVIWNGSGNDFWVRPPNGPVQRAVQTGSNGDIEALAPDGRFIFDIAGDRFLISPPYTGTPVPQALGAVFGKAIWRDSSFYIISGPSVLRVQ